jgi:hypothetical protein
MTAQGAEKVRLPAAAFEAVETEFAEGCPTMSALVSRRCLRVPWADLLPIGQTHRAPGSFVLGPWDADGDIRVRHEELDLPE